MFGRLLGLYAICTFSAEFCQLQNSLCVQVLRSPILAESLHGTLAVGVSQTLQRGTRNRITELLQSAPPVFGSAAITLGVGPHTSLNSWPLEPYSAINFGSFLTAFVQHSKHLASRLPALFEQQSNCTHMAFKMHSEHYDSILNILTVFQHPSCIRELIHSV